MKGDEWFAKAVLWAVENGITVGTGADTFSPLEPVSCGSMITFLWRTAGEPGKTGTGPWYADAENWAGRMGLLSGIPGEYSTKASCPRSDVVYYLYRYSAI